MLCPTASLFYSSLFRVNFWSTFLQIFPSFIFLYLEQMLILHSHFWYSLCFLYYFSLTWSSSSLILSLAVSIFLFSLSVVFLIQTIIIFSHIFMLGHLPLLMLVSYYLYLCLFLCNDDFKFLFCIPFIWPCLTRLYRLFSFLYSSYIYDGGEVIADIIAI